MPSKRRPAKRSKGWEASLAHVVTIMRGPTIKTLTEARAYILKLPQGEPTDEEGFSRIARQQSWTILWTDVVDSFRSKKSPSLLGSGRLGRFGRFISYCR